MLNTKEKNKIRKCIELILNDNLKTLEEMKSQKNEISNEEYRMRVHQEATKYNETLIFARNGGYFTKKRCEKYSNKLIEIIKD